MLHIGAPRAQPNWEGAGVPAPSVSLCLEQGELGETEQGTVFL